MKSLLPLVAIVIATLAYGRWNKARTGRIQLRPNTTLAHEGSEKWGVSLGERATMVQFSTVFCTSCRATRVLLEDIAQSISGVVHVDIDAESHLDLVRELDIRSTPTTLFLNRFGVEVGRAVGAPKRDQVLKVLNTL